MGYKGYYKIQMILYNTKDIIGSHRYKGYYRIQMIL